MKEINELKEKIEILEKKLAQQSTLMNVFEKNIKDIIYFKDRKGNFIRINKALADKFNIKNPELAIGKNDVQLFKNIDEIHAKESYKDECEVMNNNKPKTGIIEHVVYPNGDDVWQITDKFPLYNKKGEIIGTWGRSIDITKREKNREELEKQSKIDSLTKILSRGHINKIIKQKIEVLLGWKTDYAGSGLRDLSLVFLDLDGFKQVNDNYGHDAGDMILKKVSSFITSKIRSDIDIFGRWGGDEFIILYPNINAKIAGKLVDKIHQQIKVVEVEIISDMDNKKYKIPLSFSRGIVDFKQCISDKQLEIFKYMFDKMKSDIREGKEGTKCNNENLKRINIIDECKNSFVKAYNLAKKDMRNNKINIVDILNYYKVLVINSCDNMELKEIIVNVIKNVFIYIADREMYKDKKKNL